MKTMKIDSDKTFIYLRVESLSDFPKVIYHARKYTYLNFYSIKGPRAFITDFRVYRSIKTLKFSTSKKIFSIFTSVVVHP